MRKQKAKKPLAAKIFWVKEKSIEEVYLTKQQEREILQNVGKKKGKIRVKYNGEIIEGISYNAFRIREFRAKIKQPKTHPTQYHWVVWGTTKKIIPYPQEDQLNNVVYNLRHRVLSAEYNGQIVEQITPHIMAERKRLVWVKQNTSEIVNLKAPIITAKEKDCYEGTTIFLRKYYNGQTIDLITREELERRKRTGIYFLKQQPLNLKQIKIKNYQGKQVKCKTNADLSNRKRKNESYKIYKQKLIWVYKDSAQKVADKDEIDPKTLSSPRYNKANQIIAGKYKGRKIQLITKNLQSVRKSRQNAIWVYKNSTRQVEDQVNTTELVNRQYKSRQIIGGIFKGEMIELISKRALQKRKKLASKKETSARPHLNDNTNITFFQPVGKRKIRPADSNNCYDAENPNKLRKTHPKAIIQSNTLETQTNTTINSDPYGENNSSNDLIDPMFFENLRIETKAFFQPFSREQSNGESRLSNLNDFSDAENPDKLNQNIPNPIIQSDKSEIYPNNFDSNQEENDFINQFLETNSLVNEITFFNNIDNIDNHIKNEDDFVNQFLNTEYLDNEDINYNNSSFS